MCAACLITPTNQYIAWHYPSTIISSLNRPQILHHMLLCSYDPGAFDCVCVVKIITETHANRFIIFIIYFCKNRNKKVNLCIERPNLLPLSQERINKMLKECLFYTVTVLVFIFDLQNVFNLRLWDWLLLSPPTYPRWSQQVISLS